MKKVAVIDFDGTIAEWRLWPQMGPPIEGVKEALQKIKDMGYEIHILSCRTDKELMKHPIDRQEQVRLMETYLEEYEIPYDIVLNKDKPIAHWYIDDRAIGFRGDWDKVVEEMGNGQ